MLTKWLKKLFQNGTSGSGRSSDQNHPYQSRQTSPEQQQENTHEPPESSAILDLFSRCADVKHHVYTLNDKDGGSSVLFVYCEGLSDHQFMIHEVVLPNLRRFYETYGFTDVDLLQTASQLQLEILQNDHWKQKAAKLVFDGQLLVHIPALRFLCSLDIAHLPSRTPEDSNIEVSIRGPRDAFVEELATNVALIRKRVKSISLAYETFVLGKRTMTTVGLLYVHDVADPKVIEDVKQRIQKMNIDGIFSLTQLEELISPVTALFPIFYYTGRPDFVVDSLMNGRFVLMVDGNPAALIAPANFMLLVKTPEDIHYISLSAMFGQSLRLLGIIVTLLLPGFWVALLAYHQDQIPFYLLATLTTNRLGIPFSVTQEMFLALIFLEILREAGARLPSTIASTLTVVGGLILGDAAIRAGILSPGIVVIGAITQVFGATISNQALLGAISIFRFLLFILSALFGLLGFFLGIFVLLVHLSKLNSFGVPFLAPMSPTFFKDLPHAFFRLPWMWKKRRPTYLNTIDDTKQGDKTK